MLITSSCNGSRVNDLNAQRNWQSRYSSSRSLRLPGFAPGAARQDFAAVGAGGISQGGEEGMTAAVSILLFSLPASFVSFH